MRNNYTQSIDDPIDLRLLDRLQNDARITNVALADSVNYRIQVGNGQVKK